jgi:hypothetical protein
MAAKKSSEKPIMPKSAFTAAKQSPRVQRRNAGSTQKNNINNKKGK